MTLAVNRKIPHSIIMWFGRLWKLIGRILWLLHGIQHLYSHWLLSVSLLQIVSLEDFMNLLAIISEYNKGELGFHEVVNIDCSGMAFYKQFCMWWVRVSIFLNVFECLWSVSIVHLFIFDCRGIWLVIFLSGLTPLLLHKAKMLLLAWWGRWRS